MDSSDEPSSSPLPSEPSNNLNNNNEIMDHPSDDLEPSKNKNNEDTTTTPSSSPLFESSNPNINNDLENSSPTEEHYHNHDLNVDDYFLGELYKPELVLSPETQLMFLQSGLGIGDGDNPCDNNTEFNVESSQEWRECNLLADQILDIEAIEEDIDFIIRTLESDDEVNNSGLTVIDAPIQQEEACSTVVVPPNFKLKPFGLNLNSLIKSTDENVVVGSSSNKRQKVLISQGSNGKSVVRVVVDDDDDETQSHHDTTSNDCVLISHDLNKRIIQESSESNNNDNHNGCTCKKSACLLLYYDCFAAKGYCRESCTCEGCLNRQEHEDKVSDARDKIKSRNPFAFSPKRVPQPPHIPSASNQEEQHEAAKDTSRESPNSLPESKPSEFFTYWPHVGLVESNTISTNATKDDAHDDNISKEKLNQTCGSCKKHASQTEIKRVACTCKKNKCLKLYCECFHAEVYCSEPCTCQGCLNREEHYSHTIHEAKENIKKRYPLAFAARIVQTHATPPDLSSPNNKDNENVRTASSSARHRRGCKCQKSNCMKNYGECFEVKVRCSSLCECKECENPYGKNKDSGDKQDAEVEHKEMDGNEEQIVPASIK